MKPLSTKTRFKLILASAFVFIIIVPIVLASSFGYKISSFGDVLTLVKTGGIYLHSDIPNTSIYVDDEYFKDNGRLLRNTLIQDLLPYQEYEVVIIKEGLHDWRKTLRVEPSRVTEASVLMLPVEIDSRAIYPFADRNGQGTTTTPVTFSINTISGKIIPSNQEYIELMNIFTGEDFYGLEEVDGVDDSEIADGIGFDPILTSTSTPTTSDDSIVESMTKVEQYFSNLQIEDYSELNNMRETRDQVAWIDAGNIRIGWFDYDKIPHYYFCLESDNCRTEILVDWDDEILEFEFMPDRNEILIVRTAKGIYAVEIDDRSDRNIQPVYTTVAGVVDGSNSVEDIELGLNNSGNIVVKDGEIFYELDL